MGLSATTAVAWHTHRDLADSQYVGTGLRNDVGDLSTRPGGAHRHLAWWAFQRVTRFLVVPADATTGRFAGAPPATLLTGLDSPEYPVLETYYYQAPRGTVTSSEAEDTCFVFGLSPGTVADWVYVVILDPTTDKDVAARIIVSNPNGATVWQLPSVPQRVDEVTPADDSDFPQDTPSAEWNEIIQGWSPATTAFELILPSRAGEAAGDPILLLSSEQLFFSIEKTSYP